MINWTTKQYIAWFITWVIVGAVVTKIILYY